MTGTAAREPLSRQQTGAQESVLPKYNLGVMRAARFKNAPRPKVSTDSESIPPYQFHHAPPPCWVFRDFQQVDVGVMVRGTA